MSSQTINIKVNGVFESHPKGMLLSDLARTKSLQVNLVAIEVNQTLIPRERHPNTRLSEGDEIEIVTLAGGG